ncbi:hypothetical protein DL96DRAFT_1626680 [Flagelloscypha sp. PMI_526]|nr:hypothetical protein DL96DRAFT_1626680 [Flagelloscypha sp. PMI_526]
MAPSRSTSGPSTQTDAKANQFVFSCSTVEFATTFTPDNYKTATKRAPTKKKKGKDKADRFVSGDQAGDSAASASSASTSTAPPVHVPRPPNAFILFRSSFIKGNHVDPNIETNHSTLSKIAGLTWNNLSDLQKEEWHQKAKLARAEHRAQFPDYSFKPADRPAERPKRTRRKVGPKDEVRCAKIAQLLTAGVQGEHLLTEINKFDQQHVMTFETQFAAPITAKSFKRRRSSAATVTQESVAQESKRKRRKRSPTASDTDSAWETEATPPSPSSAIDPEMPPLREPPSSFHVFSLSEEPSPSLDFGSFSFDQGQDATAPSPAEGYAYSLDPLSPTTQVQSPASPLPPHNDFASPIDDYHHPPTYLTKAHSSNLHIDTSSFPFELSQLSSHSSAESVPATPFFEGFAPIDSGLTPSLQEHQQPLPEQSYYNLPMEAYDPSSLGAQFDFTSYTPQQQETVDTTNMSCYLLDQQQQQQDALVAAASAAWAATWLQNQHGTLPDGRQQENVSCHPQETQQPMLTVPLDVAQYMMSSLAPPYA